MTTFLCISKNQEKAFLNACEKFNVKVGERSEEKVKANLSYITYKVEYQYGGDIFYAGVDMELNRKNLEV